MPSLLVFTVCSALACACPVPFPSLFYISLPVPLLVPTSSVPPTLSWYPPISSLFGFYTTFSHPLSNSPPTLSWYPPLILFRLPSPHYHQSPRDSPTTYPSAVLVKPEPGSLHHATPSDDVPLDTRRSSPYPCNVAGVSRGRIPITVHLMRLHEFGPPWTGSTRDV